MSSRAHVRHYFSRPGCRLSLFDFLYPSLSSLSFCSFGCCSRPIFGNSHLLTHTISLNIFLLWTSNAVPFYYLHFLHTNVLALSILCLSRYLSLPLVLLSQYLYAAPLCNTSLIHTLLHPPSPPFRSHTINAEKRAQTEVTCTEHIKKVCLNKSPNVC